MCVLTNFGRVFCDVSNGVLQWNAFRTRKSRNFTYDPQREKTYSSTSAPNKYLNHCDLNRPEHPCNLNTDFVVRMKTTLHHGLSKQYPVNILIRLLFDLNLRMTHMSGGTFFDVELMFELVGNIIGKPVYSAYQFISILSDKAICWKQFAYLILPFRRNIGFSYDLLLQIIQSAPAVLPLYHFKISPCLAERQA